MSAKVITTRVMVQSGFSVRYKRGRRWFDGIVECTGMHEAVLTPTVVVNRRNCPVLVTSSNQNSFAEKNVTGRNRALVIVVQSGFAIRYTSRRASVYAGGLTQLSSS